MTEGKNLGWEYTGGGFGGSLQGIPARDLTPEEVEKYSSGEIIKELMRIYKPSSVLIVRDAPQPPPIDSGDDPEGESNEKTGDDDEKESGKEPDPDKGSKRGKK